MEEPKEPKEPNNLWYYDEPHESGGNCQVSMTKQQAVEWMKKVYFAVAPDADDYIFESWKAIHWAYQKIEVKEEKQDEPTIIT